MRRSAKIAKSTKSAMGGGILVCVILTFAIPLAIPPHLHATELTQICTSGQQCNISSPQSTITNHTNFTAPSDEGIYIEAHIGTFTNYGSITEASGNQAFTFSTNGYISHFINYGNVANSYNMSFWGSGKGISNLTNYGTMGSIEYGGSETMTLNNFGVIRQFKFTTEGENNLKTGRNGGKISIQNYALVINENPTTFNAYTSGASLSHLLVNGDVSFKDNDSKIILDFGENFELGKEYLFSKLAVDTGSSGKMQVDFRRLTTRSELFKLTQRGDNFIVNLVDSKTAGYSTIGSLYKANIRTMNNFQTMSNSMIYPHKYKVGVKRMPKKRRVIRRVKKVSALESNESFAYKKDSNNLSDLSDSTTSTNQNSINHIRIANIDETNQRTNRNRISTNRQVTSTIPSTQSTPTNNNYYFVLIPFINHNHFFESGRYNLSGLEYGFLTAFSGKITQSNTLGTHFMMSYGSLGDSKDKDFSIKSFNLNVGLNYKFDMIWNMYLKARGDFFYFLNQVKTLTMPNAIKPNTLGFGVSVAYGKDFDFKENGILGIEVGLDYKALQSSTIELHDNTYNKSLYNLIYLDLGLNYNKYFNTSIGLWGINTLLGIKGNITANKLSKSQIHINNLNRDIDMVLDNDKILAYANISASYVLNTKDFDMEFSLAYYGNYGDRVISNGGGVEFRVVF